MSRDVGVDLFVSAWRRTPAGARAERLAANGDLARAGACGGPGWASLANGDVVKALELAREGHDEGRRAVTLLEAEALVAAGAVVAGLRYLAALSAAGSVPATVALSRRRHALGDHRGALHAADQLPMHAQAALTAGRALMALHNGPEALRRIEPFLAGGAPVPDTMTAGSFAVLAASALARCRYEDHLRAFAERLLACPDAPPDASPSLARTSWVGGLAREAWDRFAGTEDPWMAVGRLELAALAGDATLMRGLVPRAGPLARPSSPTLALLEGTPVQQPQFDDGTYHIWRTHPTRWQPWIDAATSSGAKVEVWDLAAGELPDEGIIPAYTMDDGALVTLIDPEPVPPRPTTGEGVWLDHDLCVGVGVGHDWPESERNALAALVQPASPRDAAVWITGADRALAHASDGRRTVVVAPPGDPFWAGPLPERAWPAFRVIRAHATDGWAGAGRRVAQAAAELAVA